MIAPRFAYRAARADGTVFRGSQTASDAAEVQASLARDGFFPLDIRQQREEPSRSRQLRARHLAVAVRGLATLTAAGVSLDRAIAATAAMAPDPVGRVLIGVHASVQNGQSLSRALAEAGGAVPPMTVGLISAGERAGRLSIALEQAATQLESDADLGSRLRQALAYPIILCVGGAFSLAIIVTTVLPRFAALLSDLGQELPTSTRLLLLLPRILASIWPFVLIATAAGMIWWRAWSRTETGGRHWHGFLLKIPGVGTLRHLIGTARISRALGGGLEAGLPLVAALEAAKEAAGDRALSERLGRVRERVIQGEGLASTFRAERLLVPNCLELVDIGEQSGRLAEFTSRAGDLAASEVDRALKTMLALLEPVLVVVFGGVIALVAAAMLQAVYALRPGGP
jgi:type II secretory pathway component PulF